MSGGQRRRSSLKLCERLRMMGWTSEHATSGGVGMSPATGHVDTCMLAGLRLELDSNHFV